METSYTPFGMVSAQKEFQRINDRFFEKLPALNGLMAKTLNRTFPTTNLTERFLVTMGHIAHEEFFEILTLSGNGFGIGAMKLLRGFYELVVTMADFIKYPADAEPFLDFHYINQHKAIHHAKKRGQLAIFELSDEQIQQVEANYQSVKSKFTGSWKAGNLSDMADDVDPNLSLLYTSAFLLPTFLAHTTAASVMSRMKINPETDRFGYNPEAQRKVARAALIGAHSLLLQSFAIVNDYFKLGLDSDIHQCASDFQFAW